MNSALPSAEVAADFRDALQDLKVNSRPEISNLTVIAKENTEHAQAISRELEQHITSPKTRPEWKLPALYVLDSIVKNVGTPYTVYLGRNLRGTFFAAYGVVDTQTRKSMDALFRTWKQPVPESLDPRPVFEPEVTRPIDEALNQFRARIQQSQPLQQAVHVQRPQIPQQQQWRNTPTPPQAGYRAPPQPMPHFNAPSMNPAAFPSPLRQYATPVQNGGSYSQTPQPGWSPASVAPPNVDKVKADLNQLIVSTSMEFAKNPATAQQTQGLLTNLLSLQKVLQAGNLATQDLEQVAAQVSRISSMIQQPLANATPVLPPQSTPQPPPPSQAPQQPPQLAALAALLQSSTPSVSTPTLRPALPEQTPIISTPPVPPPSTAQLSSLLASLQPRATPPPQALSIPPPQPGATPQPDLFASLRAAGLLPGSALPPLPSGPDPTVRTRSPVNILQSLAGPPLQMETSSLKVPRPHLISRLYEAKPDQCRQCGKRFAATDAGKKAKSAHMDWHFSVNTRIAEASKGAVNRSWYISELEWINYREVDASMPNSDDAANGSASNNASPSKKQKVEHVVPVPTDVSEVNKVCPICQEKFEVSWHNEMQTPVWTNAIRVGKKVYHKTCYDEVVDTKRSAGSKGRDSPSVLGKRKLEVGA